MDVLGEILRCGALVPHTDTWDGTTGIVKVVAVSALRPYAAGYADMHLRAGDHLEYQYGSTGYWGRRILWRMLVHGGRSLLRFPLCNLFVRVPEWVEIRVGRRISVWKALQFWNLRSSIAGNYPILIGLRDGSVTSPTQAARYIHLHEQRSRLPIAVTSIAHIEVPRKYLAETATLLRRSGLAGSIPVIPRELGEFYSSEFSPFELLRGSPFRDLEIPRLERAISVRDLQRFMPKLEWFPSNSRAMGRFHGRDHLVRVLVVARVIADLLMETGDITSEQVNIEALQWAAVLHDIRRRSDLISFRHAEAAARWARKRARVASDYATMQRACRLIELHDRPWHEHVDVEVELSILKDADALDRVRLERPLPFFVGWRVRSKIGLDARLLRHAASRRLIPLARELYRLSTADEERRRRDPCGCVLDAAVRLGICHA